MCPEGCACEASLARRRVCSGFSLQSKRLRIGVACGVEHPTIDGALCRGPDALPLVHDDAPRDEAIAAFSRMFWAYSYSAQTGKDEQVFRIVSL
jgi:hypothetical protein